MTFSREVLDTLFGFDDKLREMFLEDFDAACTDPMKHMFRAVGPQKTWQGVWQFASSFSERGFTVVALVGMSGCHLEVRKIMLVDHPY